jgi:predicted O-methyltransferase YrrM
MERYFKTIPDVPVVGYKDEHLKYAVSKANQQLPFAEFGVFIGTTARVILSVMESPTLYLFDSFEGLPEMWGDNIEAKGSFATAVPTFDDPRAFIVKGWFQDTLEMFFSNISITSFGFIHMDADIYSSTKYVFEKINNYIKPGTIIAFDEFIPGGKDEVLENYAGWKRGYTEEYNAFMEYIEKFNRKFEYLAQSYTGWGNVSIKIIQ